MKFTPTQFVHKITAGTYIHKFALIFSATKQKFRVRILDEKGGVVNDKTVILQTSVETADVKEGKIIETTEWFLEDGVPTHESANKPKVALQLTQLNQDNCSALTATPIDGGGATFVTDKETDSIKVGNDVLNPTTLTDGNPFKIDQLTFHLQKDGNICVEASNCAYIVPEKQFWKVMGLSDMNKFYCDRLNIAYSDFHELLETSTPERTRKRISDFEYVLNMDEAKESLLLSQIEFYEAQLVEINSKQETFCEKWVQKEMKKVSDNASVPASAHDANANSESKLALMSAQQVAEEKCKELKQKLAEMNQVVNSGIIITEADKIVYVRNYHPDSLSKKGWGAFQNILDVGDDIVKLVNFVYDKSKKNK